ncbi:CMD-domain-containing protein [Aspergillus heterothallicus]
MSTNPELFRAGLQNRREVVGDTYVDQALQNGRDEFAFPGQQLVTEVCWGNIWSRPGLERKQRSLLNIGILMALKSWPELGVHTRGAIRNGVTELEIREAILHATVYCGVPAGIEAFKVAAKVINDMVASGQHTRQLKELAPDFEAYVDGE